MNDENIILKLVTAIFIGIFIGIMIGGHFGVKTGSAETITKLTHEAVREKAGTWVAGEQGEAVFKWLSCVPAKPQEVKK